MCVFYVLDDILDMMRKADEKKMSPNRRAHSPDYKQEFKPSKVMESIALGPVTHKSPPKLARRNSTGTIYIDSTMSKQDNKATIKCVCAVIRAHMVEAEEERIVPR